MPRNRRQSLTDKLPHWGNLNGVILTRHNAVEIGIEFTLPTIVEVSHSRRDQVADVIHHILLNDVPEKHKARLIIERCPLNKTEMVIPPMHGTQDHPIISYLHEENSRVLDERRREGLLMSLRYFLIIRMDTRRTRFGRPIPKSVGAVEKIKYLANQRAATVVASMHAAGFGAHIVRGQAAAELIHRYLNPGMAVSTPPLFKAQPALPAASRQELQRNTEIYSGSFREQLTQCDIDTSEVAYLKVGDRLVNTISIVKEAPSGTLTEPGMCERLLNRLSSNHMYLIMDFNHSHQATVSKKMADKAAGAQLAAEDTTLGTPDMGNATVLNQKFATFNRFKQGNEHVYRYGINLVLIGRNERQLEEVKQDALSELANMSGGKATMGNTANIEQYTRALIPYSGHESGSMFEQFSTHMAHFFPTISPWKGNDNPIEMYRTRLGTLIGLNPGQNQNYGTLIIGSSGSGKTMLTQTKLWQYAAAGADLIVVDPKQDYADFFQVLGGQVIPFTPGAVVNGRVVRYNAFELPEGADEPDEDHALFLMVYLRALLKGRELTTTEHAILTKTIERVYRNAMTVNTAGEITREVVTLSRFVKTMTELNSVGQISLADFPEAVKTIQELNLAFQSYLGSTPLGSFVDGESTISINNRFCYIDLSTIKDNEDMRRLAMVLLLRLINTRMRVDRSVIKKVVLEEIGVLFQIPGTQEVVERLYKAGRSYGMYPVAIDQEIGGIEHAKGILNNASQVIIGKVTPDQADEIARVLRLNDATRDQIKSLTGKDGVYREYLVINYGPEKTEGEVFQLWPNLFAYTLFTSKGAEAEERRKAITRADGDIFQAVKNLLRKVA